MYGNKTYAWELSSIAREPTDIPIVRKVGAIGIQLGPGM